MDHLPRVSSSATAFPAVPYLVDVRFIFSRPFENFNDRVQLPKVLNSDEDGLQAYSSYIQSWLFFGLLEAFFSVWQVPFIKTDFLTNEHGREVVTTRCLQDYLVAIVAHEHNEMQSPMAEKDTMRGSSEGSLPFVEKRARKRIRSSYRVLEMHLNGLHSVQQEHVYPSVWDSVAVLGATLTRARELIFRRQKVDSRELFPPLDYGAFHLLSILDLRNDERRCPHERRVLLELVDYRLPEIAFFSQLGHPSENVSHSACNPMRCEAYDIVDKDRNYKTQHTNHDCDCALVGYDQDAVPLGVKKQAKGKAAPAGEAPDTDETQAALRDLIIDPQNYLEDVGSMSTRSVEGYSARQIPFSRRDAASSWIREKAKADYWTKTLPACTYSDGELQTHHIPFAKLKLSTWLGIDEPKCNLVAFSHVWGEGLGNPTGNQLPRCQLGRLQKLANGLFSAQHRPVPFWIDTLFIPKWSQTANSLEQRKRRKIHAHALANMEWVYKGASKVLVLDKGIMSFSTHGMGPEETGARLMNSVWSTRLWTLQEGSSKERTWFQFSNVAVSWPSLHHTVQENSKISTWNDHTQLPHNHPVRKMQNLDHFRVHFQNVSAHPHSAGNLATITNFDRVDLPFLSAGDVDKRLYRVINQVWFAIHAWLEELTIDWSDNLNAGMLLRCMRGMYNRNCSNPADEALVFSSLLSSTPGPCAKLKMKSPTADERYRTLFLEFSRVPRDLLFIDQQRYSQDGSRWIPTSLLAVNTSAGRLLERPERQQSAFPKHAFPGGSTFWLLSYLPELTGLTVSGGLLVLAGVPLVAAWYWHRMRKNSPLLNRTDDGIETNLTGLRIQPCPTSIKAPFCFELKHRKTVSLSRSRTTWWKAALRRPGTIEEVIELPEAEWCLLADESFQTMLENKPLQSQALLVRVKKRHAVVPGAVTLFETLAMLTPLEEESEEVWSLPRMEVKLPSKKTQAVTSESWIVG